MRVINVAFTESQWRFLIGVVCTAIGVVCGAGWTINQRLSAIESVTIDEASLTFAARLDTGATISSINARDIEVIGGSGTPQRTDAGKRVRFTLENSDGEAARIESTIDQVRGIQTSDCSELRYHVYLTVVHNGARYRLLMNLNDRTSSRDKLLLGRNWLRQGFVVDVART